MTDQQIENITIHSFEILWRFTKWFGVQYILLFFMPYIWEYSLSTGLGLCIATYTILYSIYWNLVSTKKRLELIYFPLFPYVLLSLPCCLIWDDYYPSWWICLFLPIYGAVCFISIKSVKRIITRRKLKRMYVAIAIILILILFKSLCVIWGCKGHGTIEGEKKEILQRRDYLVDKLVTSPTSVLNEMPSANVIGEQFQGEWALYSCSMLSAALVNISSIYPETKEENLQHIDKLIKIVQSQELRLYDTQRWGEDTLQTLENNTSHVSYLSHLAWMICGYKSIGGDTRYDDLLDSLCETMNRRMLNAPALNLETYPGEPIYIPDMLVAIVALQQYAELNNGKYSSTVKEWVKRAREEWCDNETGLLVSFLEKNGDKFSNAPVKGSYTSLNCSYLTYIDEAFASEQYAKLKKYFWKDGMISGFKEYYDRSCPIGLDIDAGPIILGLSPSGTAFGTGAVTYFSDTEVRSKILRTAEKAGHTILWNGQKHYALANMALVGEAIMLAMRTNYKESAPHNIKVY